MNSVQNDLNESKQSKNIFIKIGHWFQNIWNKFSLKFPNIAQFLVFFVLSSGITVLQLVLMPLFRYAFSYTSLVNENFQVFQFGTNFNGTPYFIFDYAAGGIAEGGGGGLAYFLAVQITLAIAQIINFFAQRKITFKSNTNPWIAALWYLIAYIFITFIAAALQGWYKAPIYDFFINELAWGSTGETTADILTMIINAAISFWVFFPIFKIIFRKKAEVEKI